MNELIPTTPRGFMNLALGVLILGLLVFVVWNFFRSAYRIHREVGILGNVRYEIWGRYPRNLIYYGGFPTWDAAAARVERLDRLYDGDDNLAA